MGEIKALTSLRGIFALWVVAYHLAVWPHPAAHLYPRFFEKGYLGVDFFFILSGFVLAGSHAGKFGLWPSWRQYLDFMVRRIGRMYPLHLLVTAVCVGAAWGFGKPYSPYQVATESMLIHRWPFVPAIFQAINGPAWSISSEMLANALFPVFAFATIAGGRAIAAATSAAALAGICLLGLSHHGSLNLTLAQTLAPTIRCFCEFSFGMLAYRLRALPIHADWAVAALALAAAAALSLGEPDPVIVILMLPIILAISGNHARARVWLSIKPLHDLGELSFSIYLVHFPLIVAIQHFVPNRGTVALLSVAATFLVSLVTYRWVEVSARDWSKRFAIRHFGTGMASI